jgi:hypothetical protein
VLAALAAWFAGASSGHEVACAPGYSPCLPVVADLDCGGIANSKKPIRVTGSDQYRLDRDGDGVACELAGAPPAPAPRASCAFPTAATLKYATRTAPRKLARPARLLGVGWRLGCSAVYRDAGPGRPKATVILHRYTEQAAARRALEGACGARPCSKSTAGAGLRIAMRFRRDTPPPGMKVCVLLAGQRRDALTIVTTCGSTFEDGRPYLVKHAQYDAGVAAGAVLRRSGA